MNIAKNVCTHDAKVGTLVCDKISGAVDLTFSIKNG